MKQLNQFALVAKEAYRLVIEESKSPESAWDQSVSLIVKSASTMEKFCPREVFIGLCGQGMLKDIPKKTGTYNDNYGYARWVIRIWIKNPNLSVTDVWRKARLAGSLPKTHNGQADVIAGLWEYLNLSDF